MQQESRAKWLPGLSMAEYLELDAIGSGGLEIFRRSPAHYRHHTDSDDDPTPAMMLGRAVHTALLEPDLFAGEYVILGGCEGHWKDGRPCHHNAKLIQGGQGWCKRHFPGGEEDDVTVLDADQHACCLAMSKAARAHESAGKLLTMPGRTEASATFERLGVACRIRPDRYTDAGHHVSLKTTADASPEQFGRQCVRMGWHRSLAFYRAGLRALGEDVKFSTVLAVENTPPHAVACYVADEHDLDRAETEVDAALEYFRMCKDADDWPGYGHQFRGLVLPPWTFPRDEED